MLVIDKVQWSDTADIVVVGLGAAGAASAITAHDLGAEVLVLEKQPAGSHMSTSHTSAALFISPTESSAAMAYMEHLNKVDKGIHWTDRDTIQAWVEYSCHNKEWLEKLGFKVKRHEAGLAGEYEIPGHDSMEVYYVPGLGWRLMGLFKDHVKSRGIRVLYDTPADKLLTNVRGEVMGVRAQSDGKEINIKAAKAVIMAPGGFEFNEEMKLNYLKVYPTYFAGSPANTGDGIRMAQEVGASLWHMNCVTGMWMMKVPDFPFSLVANFGGSKGGIMNEFRDSVSGNPCGYIIVDKRGRRYTSEQMKPHALYYELALYDSQSLEYPRVPSYWIFDRKRLDASPLPQMLPGLTQYPFCKWSKDNRAEVEKGWIAQGNSIRELAHKLKIEPEVLEREVQKYNKYCDQKEDPEFHRPPQHLKPLSEPPFSAVEFWPGGFNTRGGPRRNRKGQVLNTDGNPIPRLYSAGEFGSIFGLIYPTGGGNIAECIAFGRISAENAFKESRTT